jgi:hypothetical protein
MNRPRNLWPYGVIAAFLLFAGGLATTVTIAVTHPEDLVNANYYENEVVFQRQIDNTARAEAAGAALRCDPVARQMVITLPVRQLAQQFSGTVRLYRPDSPQQDREQPLAPGPDGTQTVSLAPLAPGPWRLKVAWRADGKDYYLEQKFIVPAKP